jgi:amino acid transporter
MYSIGKKTIYRIFQTIISILVINMYFVFTVFASDVDFKSTILYTGTRAVIQGATIALTAIVVILTIFLSVKAGVAWQLAEDQEKPQKKKTLIHTIAIGVLLACLGGLITLILGAYGLTDGESAAAIRIYYFAENVRLYLIS